MCLNGPIVRKVALSSAENEYNACAFTLSSALHVTQVYNALCGNHPDSIVVNCAQAVNKWLSASYKQFQSELVTSQRNRTPATLL